MARRHRIHVAQGIYYLSVAKDRAQSPLFRDDEDFAKFTALLGDVAGITRSEVLGYAGEGFELRLFIRIDTLPTGRFMQQLMSRYARASGHRTYPRSAQGCAHYRAVLLEAELYLLRGLRCVHWFNVPPGSHPDAHAWSSHRYYAWADLPSPPWLNTQLALHRWSMDLSQAQHAYRNYIAHPPAQSEIELFERGSPRDQRVLGSESFLRRTLPYIGPARSSKRLEHVIESVCRHFELDPQSLLTRERNHQHTSIRALIAWHASRRNICLLKDIATRLQRSPPGLLKAIKHYRRAQPELFKLSSFPDIDESLPQEQTDHHGDAYASPMY